MSHRSKRSADPEGTLLRFTETELRRQFDTATFERGDAYQRQGHVLRYSATAGAAELTVTSLVKGSGGQLYRTSIDIHQSRHGPACEGFCSCPVEVDCKHVVATLLQMIRKESVAPPVDAISSAKKVKAADPLAGPLGMWLNRLSTHILPAENSASQDSTRPASTGPAQESILYCFSVRHYPNGTDKAELALVASRPLKAGGWGAARAMSVSTVLQSQARYVTDRDRVIARILHAEAPGFADGWPRSADPDSLDWAMDRILATQRAYWLSKDGVQLSRGPDRAGGLTWQLALSGNQVPQLVADEAGLVVLPGSSPWVIDPESGRCGKLMLSLPQHIVQSILDAPAIPPEAAQPLAEALVRRFPDVPIPVPATDIAVITESSPPVPVLRLGSRRLSPLPHWGGAAPAGEDWVDGAWLSFDYGGVEIPAGAPQADIRRVDGSTVHLYHRQSDSEQNAIIQLAACGFVPPHAHANSRVAAALSGTGLSFPLVEDRKVYGAVQQADPIAWPSFLHATAPAFAADGWRIVIEEGFRHRTVDAEGDWHAEVTDKGGWWFSLDLGIEVDGQRIALLPLLVAALGKLRPGESLESLSRVGTLYSPLPDGRVLALPIDRVRPLVEVLVELFEDRMPGDGRSFLDISLAQAMGLAEIADAVRLRWVGGARLRDIAVRLREGGIGHSGRRLPSGFTAELRHYQHVGFAWMQFLAEEGLGGVLADDMGLGKTVQTLAHILAEKESGNMDAPFLVVCPTSLVATWRNEASRFAPNLRLITLHGQRRPRDAAVFGQADVVISTYPLLLRDADVLTKATWHGVVLDEAQAIKNPAARWTQIACRLQAGHRLCLTGTPVENHLGEAWSLFQFLMPGLLGDAKSFAKIFRTPIEKKGDSERRLLLSRRLKPFLLRRTKTEVAAELPPKTEMVRRIDLNGGQRDLYETLRLAMDEKVRKAVAVKGLARSSIVILDALLKLRQVCCDPSLVRLKVKSRTMPGSAKLDHLMEFLPALVEEGRRILLFSQFTSMLDLVKPELIQRGISFVELTGATLDRETPVERFQEGEVPLFLISLKAGGVGLTLTAADTVIHYDPWWNPAVEDQATDRAHRIGQDKPVLVYKLIAAGTVEERMLELQARKRNVAAALFDRDAGSPLNFTEEDLSALFQPIADRA